MFPKVPKVEVFAPTTLFAGNQVTVEIVITAEVAVKIEYIDVRITGQQGWRIGSNENTVSAQLEYPALAARLRGEGELPAGISRYRTSFELPADMPPSHTLSPAWSYLLLFVRVAIPWWLDGKYRFTLPVRVPPPLVVERNPMAFRSTAVADAPRLELSLASTRLVAGETVVGSCALFHVDDRKPREVELTLVPSLQLHRSGRTYDRRGPTLGVSITIPAGGAGASVPFQFRLPAEIAPSFSTSTHALRWWLVARTGSFFGGKLEVPVPLVIFDASASARSERLIASPWLSDHRIAGAFQQFATERGWQPGLDDDEPDQLVYTRRLDSATLHLGYVYRGEAGSFVVARIAYPSLGLELAVTPSSRIRELFAKDIEIDLAEWDRTHHVSARSPAQTEPFLRAVVPELLLATRELGRLRQWSDTELNFERQVLGVDVRDLARAADLLDDLARELGQAPIAPPDDVVVDLAAWRALAQRLSGRMSPGDLSIEGTLDLRPVSLEIEREDGRPARLRARVGDLQTSGELAALTEAERAELPAEFDDVQLDDGVASAALAIDDMLDPQRVRELVVALRAMLARRDPNPGPYR